MSEGVYRLKPSATGIIRPELGAMITPSRALEPTRHRLTSTIQSEDFDKRLDAFVQHEYDNPPKDELVDWLARNQENPMSLPLFKCHKIVQAALIVGVLTPDPSEDIDGVVLLLGGVEEPLVVTLDWLEKHTPTDSTDGVVGGMLVIYEDGYQSWSPKDVFDAGYTSVEELEAKAAKAAKKAATVRGKNLVAKLDKLIDPMPPGQLKLALQEARRIAQVEGK